MELSEYVRDRGAQAELARLLDVPPVLVHQWAKEKRPVPPRRCIDIEIATAGQVTRRELRKSDWHKFWPELAAPTTNEAA